MDYFKKIIKKINPSQEEEKVLTVSKSVDLESQSFMDRMKSNIQNKLQNRQAITTKVQEVQQAVTNWQNFAIFFILGLFLILVSFTFLPVIIIMPAKFGAMFSLGSLSLLVSLGIIKGTKNLLKMFFKKDKIAFFAIYILTLILTLYYSLIQRSYIMVILCSMTQFMALAWLFASHFPAGTTGMKFITKQMINFSKNIVKLVCRKQSSFLPI